MNWKKNVLGVTTSAAALLFASGASALAITNWTFDVTTAWDESATIFEGDTPGGESGGTPDVTPTTISWGATGGSFTGAGADRSALDIENAVLVGQSLVTNGGPTPTSTVVHYNNALAGDTNSLLETRVSTTFTLTPDPDSGIPGPVFTRDITVSFFETTNSSPCGFTTVGPNCDDIFVIPLLDLTDSFEYEGVVYMTEISALGLGPLTPAECGVAGLAGPCVGFKTIENAATRAPFFVSISAELPPASVPVPATLAMMGLGLLLLGRKARLGATA